jgi:hypothetical protein
MTEGITIALIAAITQLVVQAFTLRSSLRNGHKSDRIAVKAAEIHNDVNGKAQQLIEATATLAHAQGMKDEHDNPT